MSAPHTTQERTRRVLLALNDLTVGSAYVRILETQGHVAVATDDPIEAFELGPFDVIVTDLGVGTDAIQGLDLAANLYSLGQRPAVILVTDGQPVEPRAAGTGITIHAALPRPLLPDDLIEAVESSPATECDERTSIEFSLVAEEGAAEDAARELVAWCTRADVTPPARARIGSAVAEIVQNTIEGGATTVQIEASMGHRQLDVTVSDDGLGFDTVAATTTYADNCSHGLGRARALAEDLTLRSVPGRGTQVSLRFGVTTIELESDDQIDLTDLDYFAPATSKELLTTLAEDPDAPIVLSPALAVVVGRLLLGPDPHRVLQTALRS